MLKRLYVDNYKCLVSFEFTAQPIQLLLGVNGTGKSSIFDILETVRNFVTGGGRTLELFPTSTLTRWDQRNLQTFEIEADGNGGTYQYKLEIQHKLETKQSRVQSEQLTFDHRPLFSSENGNVQLYRDDHSKGPEFSSDWTQSGLSLLGRSRDNTRLMWFREWVGQLLVIRPNPFGMSETSDRDETMPKRDLANFANWFQHLVLEKPGIVADLRSTLSQVWKGFDGIKLEKVGPSARSLKVSLRNDGTTSNVQEFGFGELSEGQRTLIALHTLLEHTLTCPHLLLCLDEPDNFVALAEIQPWLMFLCDTAEETEAQVLLISHHPEVMDFLSPDRAVILQRTRGGPTRVIPFPVAPDTKLKPSELIARGWEDE